MTTARAARVIASCSVVIGMVPSSGAAQQAIDTIPAAAYAEDFETAWRFVRDTYAYFHLKQTDWDRVREIYRPRAAAVTGRRQFLRVLEQMMEELYDPHAHLSANTASSPRLVPSGTDLWAEWRGDRAYITDVRASSEAERAGLLPGLEIRGVGGVSPREAVRARLPKALRNPDPAADDWALRAALAGNRDSPVTVDVVVQGRVRRFHFRPGITRHSGVPLTARILDGNIGFVRVHDALGDSRLIPAWDSALVLLRGTQGLVLDLRDTPGGGNSTVARGLLSRLIQAELPYQRHELAAEERDHGVRRIWVEHVAPRGPFQYDKPMVLLVGRWTGSMGEGITIGLDAMQRATIVGTAMAGLRGATYGVTLPHTGIGIRVPAERLYHVNGTPREDFVPRVRVAPARRVRPTDTALDRALWLLIPKRLRAK